MKTELFEMAFERKVIIEKCRSLSAQICFHIVKLTCFDNPNDVRGHLKSLDGWLDDIYSQKLKTPKKNKKLDADIYYKEIWFDRVDDYIQLKDIAEYIKRRDYKNVPLRKVDYQELYNKLCKMMNDICYDIESNNLEEFDYYLDKYKIEYK
jgi:hypothetical protein